MALSRDRAKGITSTLGYRRRLSRALHRLRYPRERLKHAARQQCRSMWSLYVAQHDSTIALGRPVSAASPRPGTPSATYSPAGAAPRRHITRDSPSASSVSRPPRCGAAGGRRGTRGAGGRRGSARAAGGACGAHRRRGACDPGCASRARTSATRSGGGDSRPVRALGAPASTVARPPVHDGEPRSAPGS